MDFNYSLLMSSASIIDFISRPKLPRGLSYVLKTSQLIQVLTDARIDCHIDLVYWAPQSGNSVLEGTYWLPNENVPYPRVYVRAGAVASASRAAASEALRAKALPDFVRWLREILSLPKGSTRLSEPPYFNATFVAEELMIANRPQYKIRKQSR
jgi:hypothetical protein